VVRDFTLSYIRTIPVMARFSFKGPSLRNT
jgi:hypothetical protein